MKKRNNKEILNMFENYLKNQNILEDIEKRKKDIEEKEKKKRKRKI